MEVRMASWRSRAALWCLSVSVVWTPAAVRAGAPCPLGGNVCSSREVTESREDRREGGSRREGEALSSAIRLAALDGRLRVLLIEPELAPDAESVRRLDAFVVREVDGTLRRIIYVNRRSEIVRRAAAGSALFVGILAAVLHHEAQHLAGASEEEARRAELAFFNELIARGDVPAQLGRRYLQLLNQAPRAMRTPSP